MNALDAICLSLYVIILAVGRSKDALWVTMAFGASVLYTSSPIFQINPNWLDHIIITLSFLSVCWLLTFPVFLATTLYIVYHWLVAGDYIFLTSETTVFVPTFYSVSPFINLIIMASIIYAGFGTKYNTSLNMGGGWLYNLFSRKGQA